MKEREALEVVRGIVAMYFGEGHVFYAESAKAAQVEPYITFKAMYVRRQVFPSKYVGKDEYQRAYREITVHCEMNLYTRGRDRSERIGVPIYENTALNDMIAFQDFLDSDEIIEEQQRNNIAIVVTNDPRDMSFLQNSGTAYQYRALIEFDVRFVEAAYGGYGQDGYTDLPSDSGGGSTELITGPYVIDDAEIEGGYE